jgi:hypothetical protein|tara:strand:+ start:45 stop:290 length:246 start_codon:yes stop_codon:yes gene_type:complete
MSKVISAVANDAAEETKLVSIKHTRVMKNANGNDVTVLDYEEQKSVDLAIADAEAQKAKLESMLEDVEAELVEYQAIKDAE